MTRTSRVGLFALTAAIAASTICTRGPRKIERSKAVAGVDLPSKPEPTLTVYAPPLVDIEGIAAKNSELSEDPKPVKEIAQEETQIEPSASPRPEVKKKSPSILRLLGAAKKSLDRPPLTTEEEDARERVIKFLEKYGTFNYASVEPFIQGLMKDDEAIENEIEKIKQEESVGENIVVYTEDEYQEMAKKRIAERARKELIEGLEKLGVDPSTATSQTVPASVSSVKDRELLEFQVAMNTIDDYSKKVLGKKTRVEFKGGFSVGSAKHIGNFGTPPGGKLVDTSN